MKVFTHSRRPVHLGPLPMERLPRLKQGDSLPTTALDDEGLLIPHFDRQNLGWSISEFMCVLDGVRAGQPAPRAEDVPTDPQERANHLKAASHFLDATLVGVAQLEPGTLLDTPQRHPRHGKQDFTDARTRLSLRYNPMTVIKQIEASRELAQRPIDHHRSALVIAYDFPRDPEADEPGTGWMMNLQVWRAALRANETACVLANYLRMLGFDARAHSATTSEVKLKSLALAAGIAMPDGRGGITNPYVGDRFALAVVTTEMEMAADAPLAPFDMLARWRAKGPSWWLGRAAPRGPRDLVDMTGRPYHLSRYPTEKLKRVEQATTFIDEDRVPRVPKSSEMFTRASFGDLGKPAHEASKESFGVSKAPIAAALRLALNVYSLLQRGEAAPERAKGYDDPERNAQLVKATLHWLGADVAGVSRAPDWVWYSHKQEGTKMPVQHPMAASVMIDQGFETMAGASGDDWISSAQSMRTYMRAALVCGVVGEHLRNLGFSSTAHTAAESDVIQTPLMLLAGLGEVSRLGDSILNPFLGPRVKTGVMTTDLPMKEDGAIDFGLQNFCNSCRKCARECPSGAITAGPKVMFNGYEIWKADTAKCTQYRMTNVGGAMCGRCMKTCPWNLAGLVQEAPFRWAAIHFPPAARWLAKLDDKLNRGTINPVKKWWWDIARDKPLGRIKAAAQTNVRELNKQIDIKREDQTLAMYPIQLAPPPLPMPWPLQREEGIAAYDEALSPVEYRAKQTRGETEGLVGKPVVVDGPPPVFVAKVGQRWKSSADGKIDLFEIVSRDGSPLPAYEAGAHIDVAPSAEYFRQYSLASNPADPSSYLIGVLREDEGRGGSQKIHQTLQPGAPVVISQPRNHFPLASGNGRHLLIGGGIGVTPMIAMAHTLWREGRPFELYYKAKTRAQAAFIPELEAMPWRAHVHFHFSDEDRLDVETLLHDYEAGDHVYTCGPAAMMDQVLALAARHGWPEDATHREYFAVPDEMEWENHPFEIEIASTGALIPVAEDERATQALEKAGIEVDVKCSDGLCGVCQCGYLSGDVEHRDFVLSKAQKADRIILCASRAAKPGGRIVLDL